MAMKLITTNTSSNAATSEFTSSIDSTYKLYIFKFISVHSREDSDGYLCFQGSTNGGSSYGVTSTTTMFMAEHSENDAGGTMEYVGSADLAQSTSFHRLTKSMDSAADESCSGTLWLFNPSNTTYVKHWYSRINVYDQGDISEDCFSGGYFNTTSAINALQFKCGEGGENMDGTIKMYGVG